MTTNKLNVLAAGKETRRITACLFSQWRCNYRTDITAALSSPNAKRNQKKNATTSVASVQR